MATARDARPLDGVRILLVDDDDDSREVLCRVLEAAGGRVTAVSGAAQGLKALAKEVPDAVVCDIMMPDEDGHAFLKKVRALPKTRGGRVPAVAVTANSSREARIASRDAGFHYHLEKPVEPLRLVDVLAGLVRVPFV